MLKTPVDWKNRTHEKAFKRIWRQLKGKDEEFPGQKSEQWKSLGFQGADPQTDFRGMGWLALDAMVYWSEKHSTIAKEMVRNQDERTYPLCTAVINCVSLAVRLLFRPESASDTGPMARIPSNFYSDEVQKSDLFQLLCYSRSEEDPFYEFLVVMLRVMDRLSVEMQAGYMDFPRVLNAVEQTLRFHLSRKPRELSTLFKWLWTPT